MSVSGLIPIQRTVVGSGGVSSVIFDNIPQVFSDLYIIGSVRDSGASPYLGHYLLFNNITSGGFYSITAANAFGSVSSNRTSNGDNTFSAPAVNGATSSANTFGYVNIYIPQYRSSNFKQFNAYYASPNNSTASFSYNISTAACLVRTTSSITRIVYVGSSLIVQGSSLTLYGVLSN